MPVGKQLSHWHCLTNTWQSQDFNGRVSGFSKEALQNQGFFQGALDTQARGKPLDPNSHLPVHQRVGERCYHQVGAMHNLSLHQRSQDGASRSCVATGCSLPAVVGAGPPCAPGQADNVARETPARRGFSQETVGFQSCFSRPEQCSSTAGIKGIIIPALGHLNISCLGCALCQQRLQQVLGPFFPLSSLFKSCLSSSLLFPHSLPTAPQPPRSAGVFLTQA